MNTATINPVTTVAPSRDESIDLFSFTLPKDFVDAYAERPVDWGYPIGPGVSLGEITFIRTYSRLKPDGSKERWFETCERVINGMYSLQKNHCLENRLPWSDEQATRSATDAYDRMFALKWLPPGRGLWMMGTEMVMKQRNSAALQNCAFISTDDFDDAHPSEPFEFLMEASMLGIGVGLNTAMKSRNVGISAPAGEPEMILIDDSREGWVSSTGLLIDSYLVPGSVPVEFDYSLIRPAGAPIKGFGGTAAGPGPLIELHSKLRAMFTKAEGRTVDTEIVADIANMIGVCVVAGNVRRSAEILLGDADDEVFKNLKNPDVFPERNSYDPANPGWGWMSNNSIYATVAGTDYAQFQDAIATNGEPGFVWLDVVRSNARAGHLDDRDTLVAGVNPCAEQFLESGEMCTLVECFMTRHDDIEDFKRTLKFAYLYGKTVTLLPTGWEKTNAVMMRNRRIGCSLSGIAGFADTRGLPELRRWMDEGYDSVQQLDDVYSRWLCVRESVRTTTVKPSGTVSILAGVTPGVHWAPGGKTFMRTIRFSELDPLVGVLEQAGYLVEDDVVSAGTKVVYFPVSADDQRRSERDVSIFEKIHLAVTAQRYWSDNAVSVTVSFDPETEAQHIPTVLHMHEGTMKSVSFLPLSSGSYPQMPYQELSPDRYAVDASSLAPVDLTAVYSGGGVDAAGESGCATDVCEIKAVKPR